MPKICSKCHQEKDENAFERRKTTGKLIMQCRACRKAAHTVRYALHRERYLANKRLKRQEDPTKDRERCRRYRMNNREAVLHKKRLQSKNLTPEQRARKNAKQKAKRAADLEGARQYDRAYYAAHPEAYKRSQKKYHARHPEMPRALRQRRLAHINNAPVNDFTAQQWAEMQETFDHRCAYCGKKARGRMEMDHITPFSKGGSNTASNIVLACRSCNARKKDGPPLRPVQPLLLTVASPKKKRP